MYQTNPLKLVIGNKLPKTFEKLNEMNFVSCFKFSVFIFFFSEVQQEVLQKRQEEKKKMLQAVDRLKKGMLHVFLRLLMVCNSPSIVSSIYFTTVESILNYLVKLRLLLFS